MPVLLDAHEDVVDADGGTGTSLSSRPGPAWVLTRACIAGAYPRGSSSDQSMTGFSTVPMPSTSQRTQSPGSRKTGGSRKTPTPDGRAGRDDVAGLQGDDRADELDERRDVPDHVGGRAVLHQVLEAVPVDAPAAQAQAGGGVQLVRGDKDRAHRQERVRALGAEPLTVALLAFAQRRRVALPVPGADVVDDHVARDMLHGVGAGHPPGASGR